MDYKIINFESEQEWKRILKNLNHSYFHSWEYASIIQLNTNVSNVSLLILDFDGVYGITTFTIREKIEGYKDIYTPYGFGGFVFTYQSSNRMVLPNDMIELLDRIGRENNLVTGFFMNHPIFYQDKNICTLMMPHHTVYEINLELSLDELWKRLNSGHKYEINKAKKDKQLSLINDKSQLLQPFIDMYFSTMKRVNASDIYFFSHDFLTSIINSNNAILLGIKKGEQIVACVLFLFENKVAEYFISAAQADSRGLTRLLIWEAFEQLKRMGVSKINLGGGVSKGDSLDDFKRRFGGESIQMNVLKYIFDTIKYQFLLKKYNIINENIDFFPPYWKT